MVVEFYLGKRDPDWIDVIMYAAATKPLIQFPLFDCAINGGPFK